ncbi:MAG TPA: carboxypeptidase regulatory-like domain-containing protein [Candidatus Acidoferrum sp.]|nr:carboxypeptidase regulatory-like domain-containing protein [Candidatus Acidoferrum sp.]
MRAKNGCLFQFLRLCFTLGLFGIPWLAASQPASPALSIQSSGGNVVISWSGQGFWLQAADSLDFPTPWFNNTQWSVVNNGGDQFSVSIAPDGQSQFFRLVASPSLPPPTGLTVHVRDGTLEVDWDAVANAASYNLYLAADPGVRQFDYLGLPGGMKVQGLSDTNYVFDSLVPGVQYYFVASAVATNGDESADSNEDSGLFGSYGQVHGSLYTLVFDGTTTNQVPVPGVTVSLVNTNTGATALSTSTDGDGEFNSGLLAAGNYEVCWSAHGYLSGCSTQQVTVSNDVVYLDAEQLYPAGGGLVFGTVSFQDGTPAVFQNALFGLNLSAGVTLSRVDGYIIASTTVNGDGQYVLAGVPRNTNLVLAASLEQATVQMTIDTTVTGLANLVLPTMPPQIESVTASLAGQTVSYAPPSATVQVHAAVVSPYSGSLNYTWQPDTGAAGLTLSNSDTVPLLLPPTNSPVIAYVLVSDGYGGYAVGTLNFLAQDQVAFSGFVADTNGNSIADAQVTVNDQATLTDTNGAFSLTLAEGGQPYAFNIQAAGYVPYSASFQQSSVGETYYLAPLTMVLCTNWTGVGFQTGDGNGTIVQLADDSLLDGSNLYFGPICIEIQTYDPCSYFPAGNDALGAGDQPEFLAPQATAFVQITGASGQVLSLATGAPATVTLPTGPTCAALGMNIFLTKPSWLWDPTNAVWRMLAQATNGVVAPGSYTGPAAQLGLLAVGAPAAKGRLQLKADRTLNLPLEVRLSSQPNTIVLPFTEDRDADTIIVGGEVEIPLNVPITIQVLNPKEAPGQYQTNPNDPSTVRPTANKTVIAQFQQTFTNSSELVLSLSNQVSALTTARLQGKKSHFLSFPVKSSGVIVAGSVFDAADAYYRAIGFPRIGPNTFQAWLIKNAFLPKNGKYPEDFTNDASALYFNATDLGFARYMYMRTSPGADGQVNIAYYVVNYNTLEDALADTPGKTLPPDKTALATVAMDYAYDTVQKKRYTKFYVFDNGSNPTRPLRPNADLDGTGAKINPNLCVICHGSQPVSFVNKQGFVVDPDDGDVKGRFIPFDLESFTYATKPGVAKAAFRKLNQGIYLYTPMTVAMSNLLTGWYGGALTNGNNNDFTPNLVPAGWGGNAQVYLSTVRISCRGCHAMRSGKLGFASSADFASKVKGKSYLVCGTLEMPNAQRTFSIFWGSQAANVIKPGIVPNQPAALTNIFGWCPCPTTP